MAQIKANRGEEERKRNRQGHNERPAYIAQKEKENDDDENNSFGQVAQYRVSGEVHKVAAVNERYNLHSFRQDVVVQLLHLFVNRNERRICGRALAQQNDSRNYIVVIDNLPVFAMNCFRESTQADFGSLRHDGDVLHENGDAVLSFQNSLLNILNAADQADSADVYLLLTFLNESSSRVHVIVSKLLLDLANAQAISNKLGGIHPDLIFTGDTAETGNVNNIWH